MMTLDTSRSFIEQAINNQLSNPDFNLSFTENGGTSLDAMRIVSSLQKLGVTLPLFSILSSPSLDGISHISLSDHQEVLTDMPFIEIGHWQKRRMGNPSYLFINRTLKVSDAVANDLETFFHLLVQEVPVLTSEVDYANEMMAYRTRATESWMHYYSLDEKQLTAPISEVLDEVYIPVLQQSSLLQGGFHVFRFDSGNGDAYFVVSINHSVTDWSAIQAIYKKLKDFLTNGDVNFSSLKGFSRVVNAISEIQQGLTNPELDFWKRKLSLLRHQILPKAPSNIEAGCLSLTGKSTVSLSGESQQLSAFIIQLIEALRLTLESPSFVIELCYTLRSLLGSRMDLSETQGHLMQPVWLCIDLVEYDAQSNKLEWVNHQVSLHKSHCFALDYLRQTESTFIDLPTPIASVNFKFDLEAEFSVNRIHPEVDVIKDSFVFDPNFRRSCEIYFDCMYKGGEHTDYTMSFNPGRVTSEQAEQIHQAMNKAGAL